MSNFTTFQVNRSQYNETELDTGNIDDSDIEAGQVLLHVDRFAFTANNITYAIVGDDMKYWDFFPGSKDKGIIPVWGFADVAVSRCEGIDVGQRFYGYYPMSTHLLVEPHQVSASGFIDGQQHRQSLSKIYNQYISCANDPIYHQETEAIQMLLRPLFTTSFLLDDFLTKNEFFGADTIVLTSASSKTALGLAFSLEVNREKGSHCCDIIGLTSKSNVGFLSGLGCYDRVLSYEDYAALDSQKASVLVDFAGNGSLLGQLHQHLSVLKYSCLVGVSHWDQRSGLPDKLAGPAPQMFFAPSHAEQRLREWGSAVFQSKLGAVWAEFVGFVQSWMRVVEDFGPEAVEQVYLEALNGQLKPAKGYILSLWNSRT